MRKFQSLNPSNSRIFINFKNKDNPVSFEYPDKSSAFSIVYFPLVLTWSMIQVFILFLFTPFIIFLLNKIAWEMIPVTPVIGAIGSFFIIYFSLMFGIPVIISWIIINNENLLREMPLINKNISLIFNWHFNRIFIDKLNYRVYEIPLFDNVFMKYKATKDFGRLLEKIEVTEHDFYCISVGIFSKKEKKVKNVDYWKVKFYFKNIPKSGYLKVDYL